jgi:phosphonate transport system substrate-binding protein
MIMRRTAALVLTGSLLARGASAQPAPSYPMPAPGRRAWAKDLPVVRVGLLGGENDADRLARVDAYQKLLETTSRCRSSCCRRPIMPG